MLKFSKVVINLGFALGCELPVEVVHAAEFRVDQLPVGAEVTVPPAARALVPVGQKVKVSSTDNPQTIQIVPVGSGYEFPAPLQLAIFDSHQDRVKYVKVVPNTPFLYSFKGLSTISIESSPIDHGVNHSTESKSDLSMQIESDKSLTIAR